MNHKKHPQSLLTGTSRYKMDAPTCV